MLGFDSLICMIACPHACLYICKHVQFADSRLPICIGSIFLRSRKRHWSAGFSVQSGSSLCIWVTLFRVTESLRLWPGLRLCASLGILDTLKMTDSAVQNHVSLQGLLSREPVHFFYASRNLSQAILFFSLCFDLKFSSFLPRFLA